MNLSDRAEAAPFVWLTRDGVDPRVIEVHSTARSYCCRTPLARCFHIFYYLSGISCGAPPQVIPMPPSSDERKMNHTPSR
jgi:hypothetical protein